MSSAQQPSKSSNDSLVQAVAELRAGKAAAARSCVESYLLERSEDPRGWFLLGACKHALKDLAGAHAAFSRSIGLDSGNVQAHLALATLARETGNASAALEHYDAALGVDPDAEDVNYERAIFLAKLARLEEAEAGLRACLIRHPQSARALAALADTLLALSRYEEALERLSPPPGEATLLVRRGLALAALRRFEEAQKAFAAARASDPLAVHEFVQRAAPGADEALMLSPENIFISRAYAALGHCDWSRWEDLIAEARRAASDEAVAVEPAVAFMVRLLPLSGVERRAVSCRIAARIEARTPVLPPLPPARRAKIRVGVLSPDFREHLNAYLLLPLFELLDRRRFECYAYSLAADDGSKARARLRAAADDFRELETLSDDDAARAIRRDEVDILLDVAGHTTGGRFGIVARRPARVQVNYLGFSSSLGSTRVDYAIVDRIAAPDAKEWSEALAYLPLPFFLYDYRGAAPAAPVLRSEYGLPEEVFVFCAFHRAEKISPDAFALWMDVLRRVPRSVLWCHPLSDRAVRNLRLLAAERGIDPARLVFAPFEARTDPRYFARQRLGDLMLDSLHHNAMTTACDALAVGLPVLTLQGDAVASRAGASFLNAAGVPELATKDREAFIQTAVKLAEDPEQLRRYRETIRARRGPLFDTAGRVRALEAAFEQMLARYEPQA